MLLQMRMQRLFDTQPRDLHAEEVAATAVDWLTKHYRLIKGNFIPPDCQEVIENTYHAGLLHEVMELRACPFEEICDETNHTVAVMVSDCSRDVRLPTPRRDDDFRSRIGEARAASQVLAMADIMCTLRTAVKWIEARPDSAENDELLLQLFPRMQSDLMALNQLERLLHINQIQSAIGGHIAVAYDNLRARIRRRRLSSQVSARLADKPLNGKSQESRNGRSRRISHKKVPRKGRH
jgi:hypothetical protein